MDPNIAVPTNTTRFPSCPDSTDSALPELSETVGMLRELSHRLRTPLATIQGYASLLEAHADEPVEPERLVEWTRRIQGEVDRATELLADLSRIRVVLVQGIQPQPVELRAVLEQAIQQVGRESERFLSIEKGGAVECQGDPLLLRRAAYHVVSLGLQASRQLSMRVQRVGPRPQIAVEWSGAEPSSGDPWLLFCRVVAQAHGGELIAEPGRLVLTLGGPEARP